MSWSTGNECCWLLISLMQCKLNPGQDTLCKLIHVQLDHSLSYSNHTLASMLQLISKVFAKMGHIKQGFTFSLSMPAYYFYYTNSD